MNALGCWRQTVWILQSRQSAALLEQCLQPNMSKINSSRQSDWPVIHLRTCVCRRGALPGKAALMLGEETGCLAGRA